MASTHGTTDRLRPGIALSTHYLNGRPVSANAHHDALLTGQVSPREGVGVSQRAASSITALASEDDPASIGRSLNPPTCF